MRVLILTPSVYPQPGGLQRYTYNLAISLSDQGHEVLVMTLITPDSFARPSERLSYVTPGKWGSVSAGTLDVLRQKFHLLRILWRTIRAFEPDRVVVTWWDPWGYLLALLNVALRLPSIAIVHGQEVLQFPSNGIKRRGKKTLCRVALDSATGVVAVSNFTGRKLTERFQLNPAKVRVIPNGLTDDYIQVARETSCDAARAQLNLNGYVILQVGRLVPRKGHERIMRVLPQVKRGLGSNVSYVIIGNGPYKAYLEQTALELDVAQDVRMTGYVSDESLHAYYGAADVVVMPAFNADDEGDVEGFGIVYLEAYAHCKPVVGIDAGGVTDAVIDGQTGLLVPPYDIDALASAIVSLLQDKGKARVMGERGQQMLETRWHWSNLSRRVLYSG